MYNKSNGSTTKRNCKQFISMPGIRRRIVSLMLVGSLPLLLGANCGLETCDIFNCDTLPFIEELLAPDEHAEDMHDDEDGQMDTEDKEEHADDAPHDDEEDEQMVDDEEMHDDDEEQMDDDHDESMDGDDHDADRNVASTAELSDVEPLVRRRTRRAASIDR